MKEKKNVIHSLDELTNLNEPTPFKCHMQFGHALLRHGMKFGHFFIFYMQFGCLFIKLIL